LGSLRKQGKNQRALWAAGGPAIQRRRKRNGETRADKYLKMRKFG
jgi:hypothetical protein